jgi:hypothetical protein
VAIRPITRCGTAVIEDSWKFNQRGNAKRGIRISSKRNADTALKPNTLPIIEAVKLAKEPSSNNHIHMR